MNQRTWYGPVIFCMVLCIGIAAQGDVVPTWQVRDSQGVEQNIKGESVELLIDNEGRCEAVSPLLPVQAGDRMVLSFTLIAENLVRRLDTTGVVPSDITEAQITVKWFNQAGQDLDEQRQALGFSMVQRVWTLNKNGSVEVADNLTVPDQATTARIKLAIQRSGTGKPGKATFKDVRLQPGTTTVKGLDVPVTGPADAGPLTTPPTGYDFAPNLVTNSALEEGDASPVGWRVEGDNSQNAAEWQLGGAYSGKRCLKISDRGPYVKSWENTTNLYVPGERQPTAGREGAREEVSARFVSDPSPATPGAYYQASAMFWQLNRRSGGYHAFIQPLRVEFLDEAGKVIPFPCISYDFVADANPHQLPGWQIIRTYPVAAPANTKSIRTAVVLAHACYYIASGRLVKEAEDRGFVLLDNIAMYRVAGEKYPGPREDGARFRNTTQQAALATIRQRMMPFVPTSPAHRPNSLIVETVTDEPGGIIVREENQPLKLGLRVVNHLGDVRPLTIQYELIDWKESVAFAEKVDVNIKPFADVSVALKCPESLPYGPYGVRYVILDSGNESDRGESRFGVIRPHEAAYPERGRMDYPFGTWAWILGLYLSTGNQENLELLGRLNQRAGVGKQGFCFGFTLAGLERLDPEQLTENIEKQLAQARSMVQTLKRFDMHLIVHLVPGDAPVTTENYPKLREAMRRIVAAMKDDVRIWIYSDEYINGRGTDLDRDTTPEGEKVMGWGRQGTPRQFWLEYLACYDGAKEADPDCMFGPEAACDATGNVLKLFFQVSPEKKLDFFGINMFSSVFTIWPPQLVELKKVGLERLPLCGQNFVAFQNAPAEGPNHMRHEVEASRRMVSYYTDALHAYPQFFFLPQWGWTLDNEEASFTWKNRVRPQYVAYANMTNCLGAGQFIEKFEVPGGVVYVRQRSARPGLVGVVWSTASGGSVELDLGDQPVELRDVWGNRQPLHTEQGVAMVPLTPMPQYILGAASIKPAPSVRMELANTTTTLGASQVTVTLTNERKETVSGTLSLIPESAIAVADAKATVEPLASGQSRSFTFDVSPIDLESDKPLALRARFDAGHHAYEAANALNFHVAVRVDQPPTVDGNLSEWSEDAPFVCDREDQLWKFANPDKPWRGPDDFSGRLWMRWDKDHLYLAARVRDAAFTPAQKLQDLWGSDAIEMAFDMTASQSRSASVTQIALGTTSDGKAHVYRYNPSAGEWTDARIALVRDGNQTVIEAAIPWCDLHADFIAQPGAAFTTAFGFNECDDGLRMLSWFHKVSGLDASAFGRVTLVNRPAAGVKAKTTSMTPANLLPNGNFDDESQSPPADLTGWKVTIREDRDGNPTGQAGLVTDVAVRGRSLRLGKFIDGEESTVAVEAWRVPVKPGEIYLIRAMAQGSSPGIWVQPLSAHGGPMESLAWMKAISPQLKIAYGRFMSLNGLALPDHGESFAPMAAVFQVPPLARWIAITFMTNWMKGDVHFDLVELYRLAA
ncbi:MAG: hypothetical protein IT440_05980 [Phycisphaeraceae bacterium]|nr:hypothetical protein [Phycisphaeraceae bacterium]